MFHYTIQWHVTARCDQSCRHCYVYDQKTYAAELRREVTTKDCFRIIDNVVNLKEYLAAKFGDEVSMDLVITGGDPLLRSDLFQLLEYARGKFRRLMILGNSYHLDQSTIKRLKESGVRSYQISVDGLRQTHDKIRRKGSFKDAFRALKLLRQEGIKENIMMTISPWNAKELIPLVNYAAAKDVRSFDFARMARFGNAKKGERIFSPIEYRTILSNYVTESKKLLKAGFSMRLGFKDHLFKLLFFEMGIFRPDNQYPLYGCHMVKQHLTILSDGKVLACRRFYDKIGNAAKEKLSDIYSSPAAQKYLNLENFQKCKTCFLIKQCRGCPAVAFGETGSPFSPDPQCWKRS